MAAKRKKSEPRQQIEKEKQMEAEIMATQTADNELVTPQAEIAEPQTTDESTQYTEIIPSEKSTKGSTKSDTKAMSERINRIRDEHSRVIEEKDREIKELSRIADALKQSGFKGETNEELLYDFMSSVEGVSKDDIRNRERLKAQRAAEIEQQNREKFLNDPEIKDLLEAGRNARFENQARRDLDEIKDKYPELNVESVFDLGEEFIELRAKGIDALKAYRLSLMQKEDEKNSIPPSTGGFAKSESEDKEFYTPEEANKFSTDYYMKHPEILEKVINSMRRYKY